jgi:hypothetical protein
VEVSRIDDIDSLFRLLDHFRQTPDEPPPGERPGILFIESDGLDVMTTFPWTAAGRREAIAWVEARILESGEVT